MNHSPSVRIHGCATHALWLMSEASHFNPGYEYLENSAIHAAQLLIDEILIVDVEEREPLLKRLEQTLHVLREQASADLVFRDLLCLFLDANKRLFDKGGINLGRSRVSVMVDKVRDEIACFA